MRPRAKTFTAAVVAAVAIAAVAVPAAATTYKLSGQLVADNPDGSQAHTTGGLVGSWRTTSFKQTAKKPLIRSRGTERFVGCIDVALDGNCTGDPTGSLKLTFRYWAKAGSSPGGVVWGACWHPIVSGTGAFAGATGVLTMVDTPMPDGTLQTDYIGNVTIAGASHAAAQAAAARPRCGGG